MGESHKCTVMMDSERGGITIGRVCHEQKEVKQIPYIYELLMFAGSRFSEYFKWRYFMIVLEPKEFEKIPTTLF